MIIQFEYETKKKKERKDLTIYLFGLIILSKDNIKINDKQNFIKLYKMRER